MLSLSEARIAIIGLGYVGLPLAVEFSKKYDVLGFDIDQERISELVSRKDSTLGYRTMNCDAKNLKFSTNINDLRNYNTFIVTVPTN